MKKINIFFLLAFMVGFETGVLSPVAASAATGVEVLPAIYLLLLNNEQEEVTACEDDSQKCTDTRAGYDLPPASEWSCKIGERTLTYEQCVSYYGNGTLICLDPETNEVCSRIWNEEKIARPEGIDCTNPETGYGLTIDQCYNLALECNIPGGRCSYAECPKAGLVCNSTDPWCNAERDGLGLPRASELICKDEAGIADTVCECEAKAAAL